MNGFNSIKLIFKTKSLRSNYMYLNTYTHPIQITPNKQQIYQNNEILIKNIQQTKFILLNKVNHINIYPHISLMSSHISLSDSTSNENNIKDNNKTEEKEPDKTKEKEPEKSKEKEKNKEKNKEKDVSSSESSSGESSDSDNDDGGMKIPIPKLPRFIFN